MQEKQNENIKEIILGGGCFWCSEAVFQNLKGVLEVESGYAGGEIMNPTYAQVSNGKTGYAEVIKIKYDENIISTENILIVFFATHDSTTLNRQGHDVGTQYRSVIFYNDEEQKKVAEKLKSEIEGCVTEILPVKNYFKAEDYHQDYYNQNKNTNSYCEIIINPKLEKMQMKFAELLK
jgi:methionine-S-sulfoxide reductase